MKTLDQFYPYITTDVLGCPFPTVDQHMILAAREFCQRASIWMEWLGAFTASGTTNTYDFDLTNQQELVKVTRVLVNDDDDYEIKTRRDLPADWDTGDSDQLDKALVHIDNTQYALFPLPVSGDTVMIQAVFRPTITASSLPDVLFDRWLETLASGTKARLMAIPKMPWSDASLARYHINQFNASVNRAANDDFAQRSAKRTKLAPL